MLGRGVRKTPAENVVRLGDIATPLSSFYSLSLALKIYRCDN